MPRGPPRSHARDAESDANAFAGGHLQQPCSDASLDSDRSVNDEEEEKEKEKDEDEDEEDDDHIRLWM